MEGLDSRIGACKLQDTIFITKNLFLGWGMDFQYCLYDTTMIDIHLI